jgi:antitoxin VapB
MQSATVFQNGPSTQAVRIPRSLRLKTKEVWIEKVGESLVITPKLTSWKDFFLGDAVISNDFSMCRNQELPQKRDDIV